MCFTEPIIGWDMAIAHQDDLMRRVAHADLVAEALRGRPMSIGTVRRQIGGALVHLGERVQRSRTGTTRGDRAADALLLAR
jgi:hypothetical protein